MIMGLSRDLRHLTLDLGFNKARTDANGWSNDAVAAEYLEAVAQITSLQHLDLRGMALGDYRISRALTSMKSLRVLSLTTGKSLSPNTLAAITDFPCLNELEVHAGHIDANELPDSMTTRETPLFPALKVLQIRAQAPLVALLFQKMPINNLKCLIIEAEQPAQAPSTWKLALCLIPAIATDSLRELAIEHHIDSIIETDLDLNNMTSLSNLPGFRNDFTIAALRPLAKLPHLQRFILDSNVTPDLCDADIEEVAKWWPDIEHLDLGGLLSSIHCLQHPRKSQLSLKCLETLSRLCHRLQSLIVNLDIELEETIDVAAPEVPWPSSHPLRYLTMGSISAPEPLRLSQYLLKLFPSLIDVDGIATHEKEWRMVQSILHASRKGNHEPGCALDAEVSL
jgi:hypothetical protein